MFRTLLLFSLFSAGCAAAQVPGFSYEDSVRGAKLSMVSPVDRKHVIDGAIARIREDYIAPDMAARMIEVLQANGKQGAYDGPSDGDGLAAHLTNDLQAVSNDKHLRIGYSASVLPQEDAEPTSQEREAYQSELDRTNCGVQAVSIMPGNVGYMNMTYFAEPGPCEVTLAAAMQFLSHTSMLVFDLRRNRGGDPRMVALLESYLFDHPVHVNNIYGRRDGKTIEYWTTPKKLAVQMPTQPVYILSSRMTFSAAEQFCYDLKNLDRAVLIGERTGGAAHPIRNHRLSDHFFISMPEYRYISPLTSSDWEGVGIAPDVPAAPWNALLVAQHVIEARSTQPIANPGEPVAIKH